MTEPLHIIGGGMAGSEAAWAAANMGEMSQDRDAGPKNGPGIGVVGRILPVARSTRR